MYVPQSIVNAVGRAFFRAVRAFPPLFALIMVAGIAIGVWICATELDDPQVRIPEPLRFWLWKGIGALCVAFYGGLGFVFIWKYLRGTWEEFCNWAYAIFDQ
ncbi:MAG TPA: hypothetical protein VJ828_04145 [Lacipirellulaceae bacterium]|nr:hypothetical protein [Lacipirellulaceae bacterium]